MKCINIISLGFLFGSIGCQAPPQGVSKSTPLFNDPNFDGYQAIHVETEDEIFGLSEQAKDFANQSIKGVKKGEDQIEALVHNIFARSDLNLLYRAEANTTANQTFLNRAANCLSMSIMTYALAKELGFGVRFQDIEIPEYWTLREGYSLLNGHINLQILPRQETDHVKFLIKGFEVDFDAQATRAHFPKTLLTISQVHAMFYNNKGADALLQQNFITAYPYFRAALTVEPTMSPALANLGYLYRLAGYYDYAETAYYYALLHDRRNLTAWRNLAFLFRLTDREIQGEEIFQRVARQRAANPFYHINLGDKAFTQSLWDQALEHYRQALRLDKSHHQVFFGLGKTYFELGNIKRSHYYLTLAKKKSRTHSQQQRYQSKIEVLKNWKAQIKSDVPNIALNQLADSL
jgi:tetratricopeptide (TPR) repeat protein